MLLDEGIYEIVDAICHQPAPRLPLLASRVSPLGSRREDPVGLVSGDVQRDAARRPDGVLAKARARASGPIENDEHLRPAGVTLTPKPGRVSSQ